MKTFFLRALVLVPIVAIAYLSQKISGMYLVSWVRYSLDDDLVMYSRWEVISWVFILLSVVALIWAWVAPNKD
jgi:hypothetical protein